MNNIYGIGNLSSKEMVNNQDFNVTNRHLQFFNFNSYNVTNSKHNLLKNGN